MSVVEVKRSDQTALLNNGAFGVERMVYASSPVAAPVGASGLLLRRLTIFHLHSVHNLHVFMFVRGWREVTIEVSGDEVCPAFRCRYAYVI